MTHGETWWQSYLFRKEIKRQLERSKEKLEYSYPNAKVTITEDKYFLESIFHIQGLNFPDTEEFKSEIKKWFNKIKQY